MRGKRKKILSLVLVLAMVVQLFAGLGNVAKAGSAKGIKVTGLGGWSGTYVDTGTEQIGFAIEGTIINGDSWVGCTITNGKIQRNGVAEDGWRIQTTGASSFVLVLDGYKPASGDVIKILAGTQFTRNGTSDVYEITNECSIKHDGTNWSNVAKGKEIKVTGLGGWSGTYVDTGTEQIGFAIEGTITGGDSWPSATITSGKILRNNAEEDGWRIQATGQSSFVLVRNGYAPVSGDTIKIPAGAQFTINGTSNVYEITNEYSIKYDGATWSKYVATTFLTLGELQANSEVANHPSDSNRILYRVYVATGQTGTTAWGTGDNEVKVYVNGTEEIKGSFVWADTAGQLLVQLDVEKAKSIESITVKKDTQVTIDGVLYEVQDDYTVYYYDNGFHTTPPVKVTPVTFGQLLGNSEVANHPGDSNRILYRVYVATGQTGTTAWGTGDNEVKVYVNGTEEIKGSFVWADTAGQLLVQLDVEKAKSIESITVKKDTQVTIDGVLYEVQNDYTVYYYAGGFHTTPYVAPPEPVLITINGRFTTFDVSASGSTPEQIGFAITETITGGENWIDCLITKGSVLLNETAQDGWKIQTTGTNTFNLVCWNYTASAGDIIKVSAGTQFACAGDIYEIEEDYAIKYDGTNWGVFVQADKFITISDRYTNFDAKAEGTTPEQIGFAINETITDGDKWIDCIITYGTILKNGAGQNGWKIQTTGENTFNLVCWNYTPAEKDIITIPAGTQFTCDGTVYEITEAISIINHDGEWVVDYTKISYKGEELVEGALYGVRIGSTKQQIEALFAAKDGIGRNLNITFTHPQEMYDADDKFQTGTYQVKVSATSHSGSKVEYNITVKGFTKDAPTISYDGESELLADAGKKFDVSLLKAIAKDGNGKNLDIKYKYSEGALNSAGALNKGIHTLYLVATDDEGQSFTRKIQLTCYEMTDIVIKGFYLQMDEQLFVATNMKNPEKFEISGIISTKDVLINGKSDVITWITVDKHSGSLYMIIEPKKGDVLTIEGGTTFLDHKNYIGIRSLNSFKGHTDGIGWIKDRLPNNGFGTTVSPNAPASPTSPATGDNAPWIVYMGLCILLVPVIVVLYRRRRFDYEEE